MKQRIKQFLASALAMPLIASGAVVTLPLLAGAQGQCQAGDDASSLSIEGGAGCAQGNDQPTELFGDGGIFQTITNVLLFLIGAISVIMMIYGGIQYVISGGDSTKVQNAKNTILYAIVGIVVALLAFALSNFVIKQFSADN